MEENDLEYAEQVDDVGEGEDQEELYQDMLDFGIL